ncbi:uncharacterized protein LOC127787982 isoform X3 [Diospyros lotus]|uniref:uncharacterized protein LOC127787982 isoform X3 n=1 Tax=Diospyros lotus TaxID=55363 RepID=UPI00225725C8|nr:uncharacterized protein LOC127787982 isoform X3 [Diospyros lotus]
MRGGRRQILIGLGVVMLLGIAISFRLWSIDYRISSGEAELLRRQFDLANREAMDESAEWRLRYDKEAENSSRCSKELIEENMGLLERLESLKQQLEAEKLKCNG